MLRDIDLEIAPGEVLGVVGPSGSGKTTLCNLVPRLWDVRAGRLLVDGIDVRAVRLAGCATPSRSCPRRPRSSGAAWKTTSATAGSTPADAELVEAARAANAHDFIDALPEGYDTIVGDRGTRLSGGQRQRVAIARAILKDAPILILDEATSSLDNESERLVQEALATAHGGPHLDRRGAPPLDDPPRRSDRRPRRRLAAGDRHPRGAAGAQDGLYAHLWRLQASERPMVMTTPQG